MIRKNGLHPSDIFRLMPDANHHCVLQIVYIRFFLLYGERFIFRLENNPEGGACVVIGGDWNGQAV